MTDGDLDYGDPQGVPELRGALADYLGRVRGVVADPGRVLVTSGYRQGLGLVCRALAAGGATRLALEDPSGADEATIAAHAGLEPVHVPVDERGLDVDALARAGADAVVVTPAHQAPTGVVLAPERRAALVAWLRDTGAVAIEDDYDAEYRYDRAAVGALQGLDPDRVVYAGTTSKVLAPALRIGWMVVPPRLLDAVREEKLVADQGTARIDQHAFAAFLARGELDRHLRRMRVEYRARRDALVSALATELPDAAVRGIAAGLHVTVELPAGHDPRPSGRRRPPQDRLRDDGRLPHRALRRPAGAAARLRADAPAGDPGRRAGAGGGDSGVAVAGAGEVSGGFGAVTAWQWGRGCVTVQWRGRIEWTESRA